MADFQFTPVSAKDADALVAKPVTRTREPSIGQQAVEAFLSSGNATAALSFPDTAARNKLALSANNFVKASPANLTDRVWVRKTDATTLTFFDVSNATPAVKEAFKAYKAAPKPGRKPSK